MSPHILLQAQTLAIRYLQDDDNTKDAYKLCMSGAKRKWKEDQTWTDISKLYSSFISLHQKSAERRKVVLESLRQNYACPVVSDFSVIQMMDENLGINYHGNLYLVDIAFGQEFFYAVQEWELE